MNIKAIGHITINVIDLEKSIEFYQRLFCLNKTGFIDMGDHTLTYLDLPSEIKLELITYSTPGETFMQDITTKGIYRHICFLVDELDSYYEICKNHNYEVRLVPTYVDKLGCNAMLIADPNGVEIELQSE